MPIFGLDKRYKYDTYHCRTEESGTKRVYLAQLSKEPGIDIDETLDLDNANREVLCKYLNSCCSQRPIDGWLPVYGSPAH